MMSFLQSRLLSFAMVVVIGFLLLVSLILSAVLSLIGTWFGHLLPNFAPIAQFLNFVVSFSVITLLFAAIYKFLPDVKVPWSDLWIGAAFTSILFTIGKFLIGLYLGSSGVSSSYGAASSLVIILIWVFYSAQILLFGAEFTQVYAKKYGSRFVLADYAVPMNEDEFDTPENPFRVPQDQESFVQAKPRSVQTRQSNQPQLLRHAATVIGTVVAIAGMLGRSRQSKGSGRYR
jgi:membrane protein